MDDLIELYGGLDLLDIEAVKNFAYRCYQKGKSDSHKGCIQTISDCVSKQMYEKGIDDLVRLVCEYYTMQERAGYCADTNNMIKQRIADFGEQLKEQNKCIE